MFAIAKTNKKLKLSTVQQTCNKPAGFSFYPPQHLPENDSRRQINVTRAAAASIFNRYFDNICKFYVLIFHFCRFFS
jgi:hypothetical protein